MMKRVGQLFKARVGCSYMAIWTVRMGAFSCVSTWLSSFLRILLSKNNVSIFQVVYHDYSFRKRIKIRSRHLAYRRCLLGNLVVRENQRISTVLFESLIRVHSSDSGFYLELLSQRWLAWKQVTSTLVGYLMLNPLYSLY